MKVLSRKNTHCYFLFPPQSRNMATIVVTSPFVVTSTDVDFVATPRSNYGDWFTYFALGFNDSLGFPGGFEGFAKEWRRSREFREKWATKLLNHIIDTHGKATAAVLKALADKDTKRPPENAKTKLTCMLDVEQTDVRQRIENFRKPDEMDPEFNKLQMQQDAATATLLALDNGDVSDELVQSMLRRKQTAHILRCIEIQKEAFEQAEEAFTMYYMQPELEKWMSMIGPLRMLAPKGFGTT